jgi:hypothetical protein
LRTATTGGLSLEHVIPRPLEVLNGLRGISHRGRRLALGKFLLGGGNVV